MVYIRISRTAQTSGCYSRWSVGIDRSNQSGTTQRSLSGGTGGSNGATEPATGCRWARGSSRRHHRGTANYRVTLFARPQPALVKKLLQRLVKMRELAQSTKRRLTFQPDAGPWLAWRDGTQELTLARGWLATDEPAVFLLDSTLLQRWHYRMPLQGQQVWTSESVAQDPHSGQPVWGLSTADNTIHLMRADGLIIDHFRVAEPLIGVAVTPNGERLELTLVHTRQTVRYSVDWH